VIVNYDIIGNTVHETPIEFFTVGLTSPVNATIGNGLGVGFIADNDAAILSPVTLSAMKEDGVRIITAAELMSGVSNNQSPTLSISALSLAVGSGTLVSNGNGTWTYSPAANDETAAAFIYTASDGGVAWTGAATLDILPVNDAPTVANAIVDAITAEDATFTFVVPVNSFADIDIGDSMTLTATGMPAWLSFNGATRTFSGTPANSDVGTVAISVRATDTSGSFVTDVFNVTVTNTNDAPVANASSASTNEDNAVSGSVTGSDVDVGSILTFAIVAGSAVGGSVTAFNAATGAYVFAPNANFNGAASFQFVANDGTVNSVPALVSVAVAAVADPVGPISVTGPVAVNEFAATGTSLVTANAVDPDAGSTVTYSLSNNAGGRFVINATTGVVSVANGILLDFEQNPSHSITIVATSSDGSTANVVVAISVGDVNPENIVGTAANETVIGGAGNDSFAMMAGNNTITGGGGIDNVSYALATGDVTANLFTGTASNGFGGTDTLASVENVTGGGFNDTLTGNNSDNMLTGNAGDDRLIGGAGNNALIGGAGRDSADYSAASGAVFVNLNSGTAANNGEGGADTLTLIEDVIGSALNDVLIGNSNDNSLSGGAGADYLIGLGGNDVLSGGAGAANTLQGGLGDDLYLLQAAGDSVVEFAAEGTDTVDASIALSPYMLGSNVENLFYAGASDFVGMGNGQANVITGSTGADYLIGMGGNDTLIGGNGAANTLQGGSGDDTYYVSSIGDSIIEFAGEGTDTVHTVVASHILKTDVENLIFDGVGNFSGTGNAGNNAITGGAGSDILNGMGGIDTLTGGLGADQFRFGGSDTGQDNVTDFLTGIDKIALDGGAFAHTASISLAQGAGAQTATSANSSFLYDNVSGILSYDADGNGAGSAVAVANIGIGLVVNSGDFMFY
jgi:Ca2+-binding RTX toxin-like protein